MASFKCPFCNNFMSVSDDTLSEHGVSFKTVMEGYCFEHFSSTNENAIKIKYYNCPNCKKQTIIANGLSGVIKGITVNIYPQSMAKQLPDYIPCSIKQDYEESYAILNLSPKAAATLSRRCLQGMIRDYWEVNGSSLANEIDLIKDKMHPKQWSVLHDLRQIGNIGAHMENDVNLIIDIDSDEALHLIKLIEFLVDDWYVQRHEQEKMLSSIKKINTEKQKLRKS